MEFFCCCSCKYINKKAEKLNDERPFARIIMEMNALNMPKTGFLIEWELTIWLVHVTDNLL